MKKQTKTKKLFFTFLLILLMNVVILQKQVKADVGSFESYDSGGSSWDSGSSWSSGGSSWDSGSSWSSSSGDHSYSSGGSRRIGSSSTSSGDVIWFFIMTGVFVTIFIINYKNSKKRNGPLHTNITSKPNINYGTMAQPDYVKEMDIERRIKEIDELFNKEEFLSWAKNLFIKLQQAWTDRDWSTIRTFETNELYEQHKNQLQGYIDNNQINVMDRICVNFANLYEFRQEGDKDVLVVRLNSRMSDYIIDATTKEVIRGDRYTERTNTYLLTFIRKTGIKTKEGTKEIRTTNCPNCGAPTQITSSGKCEYCGSVITTGEYDWALSNLERENGQNNNFNRTNTINQNSIYNSTRM